MTMYPFSHDMTALWRAEAARSCERPSGIGPTWSASGSPSVWRRPAWATGTCPQARSTWP